MKSIKINNLEKENLSKKEMNLVKGGAPGDGCGCACAYEGNGGSSTKNNDSANEAGGLHSSGMVYHQTVNIETGERYGYWGSWKYNMRNGVYILLFALASCCNTQERSKINSGNSFIPHGASKMWLSEEGHVITNAFINDTTEAAFIFDTGVSAPVLWKDFSIENNLFELKEEAWDAIITTRRESGEGIRVRSRREKSPKIDIGNTKIISEYVSIQERPYYLSPKSCGIIRPNFDNDTLIWELNFENGYIRTIPKDTVLCNSFSFNFRYEKYAGGHYIIDSVKIKLFVGTDTVSIVGNFLLDTGDNSSFGLHFNESNIISDTNYLYCNVSINGGNSISDNLIYNKPSHSIDSWEKRKWNADGSIGTRFLKHFNIFIDNKNKRIIFQTYEK